MRKFWSVLFLLVNVTAYAASFDCAKATTPQEKAICASPKLSAADDQITAAYKAALAQTPTGMTLSLIHIYLSYLSAKSGDRRGIAIVQPVSYTHLPTIDVNGTLAETEAFWQHWSSRLQYHWTQTFPAHSTTHIRHEYSPAEGVNAHMPLEALQLAFTPGSARTNSKRWKDSGAEAMSGFCLAPEQLLGLIHRIKGNRHPVDVGEFYTQWVDFILTTANTWQRPIEDFTLIVERPESDLNDKDEVLMSFCSPQKAKMEKLDANHTQVHLTNFVPTRCV